MKNGYGPTIAKRRLSRRLAELRVRSGYTANQVCDKLSWGRGKVGRFEANSWKRPELSDIRDLLRVFEVSDGDREDMEDLATRARTRAWWRDYTEIFDDSEYPGYESDAERICVYMPLVIPGLLQTKPYIDAQMRSGWQSAAWRDRGLEARLRRQQVLDAEPAPELVAVITEASLMYRWGSKAERRAQVAHLVEMARRPNIELRMLRFADGPHPGMSSLISVFEFPGDEPGMVYLENDAALQEVHNPGDVDAYVETFNRILAASLDAPTTVAHLDELMEIME